MAIPTQFSVTSTRTSPIANPSLPQDLPTAADTKSAAGINAPSAASAENVSILTGADIIPTLSVGSIDTPSAANALSVVILDSPSAASTQAQPVTTAPSAASTESQPVIGTPSSASTQAQPVVSTPSLAIAEAAATATAPSVLTANSGTLTTPPFPLHHPRFLVNNKLRFYDSVVSDVASDSLNAIKPNTFETWTPSGPGYIKFNMSFDIGVDTICIGAHNLASKGYTVEAFYRETTGGPLIAFGPSVTPTTDAAIMFHLPFGKLMRVVEVYISGSTGSAQVGYISAGEALQMQRPLFNGHAPITDSDVTKYYHNKTESGNIIGQSIRSQGYKNSFDFQNIDDGWYRTYFAPFKQAIKTQPFFAAWNLLEYPEDVGFGRVAEDITTSMQNGTQVKRSSLSFDFLGF
jgi:hypothetical protein